MRFNSFGEAAAFLMHALRKKDALKKVMLSAIGKHVLDEAKRKFGVYQPAIGSYPAWQELRDETKEERKRLGYSPNDPLFRSGDLMNSYRYEVHLNSVTIGSPDPVAKYQELGVEQNNLPARPALGPAMYQSEKAMKYFIKQYFLVLVSHHSELALKKPYTPSG